MKYILVVILIIVAFFVGKTFFTNEQTAEPAPASTQKTVTTPTPKPATPTTEQPKTEPVPSGEENPATETASGTTLVTNAMGEAEFAGTADAEKYINLNQGKTVGSPEYERITFGIVTDETDPNIVYFGTYSGQATFVAIYRYAIATKEWERLYKRVSDGTLLRVIGKMEQKLILYPQGFDDSPGPCTSLWLRGDAGDHLVTMDLNDPYASFQPFELPNDLRASEEAKQAACLSQ